MKRKKPLVRYGIALVTVVFTLSFLADCASASFNSGSGSGGGGGGGGCGGHDGFYPSEGCDKTWIYMKKKTGLKNTSSWGILGAAYYPGGGPDWGKPDYKLDNLASYLNGKCSDTNGYFIYAIGSEKGRASDSSAKWAAYKRVGSPSGGKSFDPGTYDNKKEYTLSSNTRYTGSSTKAAFMRAARENGKSQKWADDNWGGTAWFCFSSTGPANWDITPSVTIDKTAVAPGETITWQHIISASITGDPDGVAYGYRAKNAGADMPSAWSSNLSRGQSEVPRASSYTVPPGTPTGTLVCRNTVVKPSSDTNDGESKSPDACATVQPPAGGNYELVPHVNTPNDAARQGETVTFTPSVTKDDSNNSNNTSWKFCRVIVAPGVSAPAAGTVCNNPGATVVESKDNYVFEGGGPFAIGDPAHYIYTVPAGTLYGSQICYALLVDSSTQEAGHPAESVKCVIIAKTPRLQVWGNDTRVGSSPQGMNDNNMSIISTSTGSWGEYGVMAPGTISGLGSGSIANGALLSFANTPALGGYTQATSIEGLGAIPNVQAYLEKAGNAEYRVKTGISLIAAPATIGGYVANAVYTSEGTVTIDGDVINPSKGDSLSQMVIIADNINILPNVKQVDAWLIATNTINTCYLNGDTPKIGNCGDNTNASTLHINGPVMAKSLILNRTGGLDTDDNSASEVINLRGDAYIWMHKLSTETGSIRTVYTRELAPRY